MHLDFKDAKLEKEWALKSIYASTLPVLTERLSNFTQGHTASKYWSQDVKPLTPKQEHILGCFLEESRGRTERKAPRDQAQKEFLNPDE